MFDSPNYSIQNELNTLTVEQTPLKFQILNIDVEIIDNLGSSKSNAFVSYIQMMSLDVRCNQKTKELVDFEHAKILLPSHTNI